MWLKEYEYSINTISVLNHKEKEKENKKKKKINKNKYFDLVYLTEKEHQTLIKEHGLENTTKFYKKLSDYKGSKGKKYNMGIHFTKVYTRCSIIA